MRIRPSWKQGFARYAGESEDRNPWKGLQAAWLPSLGPTPLLLRSPTRRHDGVITGATFALSGDHRIPSYVTSYTGSPDLTECGLIPAVEGVAHMTLSFWAKRRSTNAQLSIGYAEGGTRRTNLNTSGSSMFWQISDGTSSFLTISDGTPTMYHWVMAYDGTQPDNETRLKIYRDGVQLTGLIFTGTIPALTAVMTTTPHWYIGFNDEFNSQTNGLFGDAMLYNRTWNAKEVSTYYADPSAWLRRLALVGLNVPTGAVEIVTPVGPVVIGSDPTLLNFGVLMPLDDRA